MTIEQPPKPRRRWYGWQTLALDGTALITLSLGSGNSTALKAAIATYALGPMIVHFAHGRVGVGLGDMVLRVGAPAVLGLTFLGLGLAADSGSHDDFHFFAIMGSAVGLIAGCSLAIAVDAAVLAREPAPPKKTGMSWAPTIVPQKGGATLGLVGTF